MDEAKKPEDGLEQLAKEASEGAQFEFNPEAWSAMEKKLDAPKRGFFWWKLFGGLAVVAVLVLLLVDWNGSEQDIAPETIQQAEQNERSAPADPKTPTTVQPDTEATKQGQRNLAETTNESRNDVQGVPAANSSKAPSTQASAVQEDLKTIDSQLVEEEEKNISEAAQPTLQGQGIGSQQATLYEGSLEAIAPRWIRPELWFDLSIKPMTFDSTVFRTAELDSLQDFKRWSFGAVVSFDLSTTRIDGFTDPGLMVGLQAEYHVSKKWSIQSGLTYSIKKYRALGEEYATPEWLANAPEALVGVEAKCFVIDIPINVRRYFTAKNGNRWFVSSGISTYLMLREDYTYDYTEDRPNWLNWWSIRNQNNHFFGIANVSVGYQTSLSQKLNLAVEPFMKLPLTGIGSGRVRFLSFGINTAITLK